MAPCRRRSLCPWARRDGEGGAAGNAGADRRKWRWRRDHPGQHLSSVPAPWARTDPAHGRGASLHELEQADADRLRRLSGLLPGQAAQGNGRRRRVPLASGRQHVLLLAGTLDGGTDRARRGRDDGLRRVRGDAGHMGTHARLYGSDPCVGRSARRITSTRTSKKCRGQPIKSYPGARICI